MGACLESEDDEDRQLPSSRSVEGGEGGVRPKPDFEARWKDDIVAIWSRAISKLPVHTDVPRLSKKITIKSEAGDFIFDGTDAKYKTQANAAVTKVLLLNTAKALDDKELRNQLKSWDDLVPDSGDTGQHLIAFFNAVTSAGGETATLLVMKAIHQRLIFPAVYCLKDLLQGSVGRFKDRAGTWTVDILICDNGKVVVTHRKEQEAVNVTSNLEAEFEFAWSLVMTIDVMAKVLSKDVLIKLSNLKVNVDTPEDTKKVIESAFEKYKTVS
jgi:hypothetical protein